MMGTGIRDRLNDRLDQMEITLTDTASALKRMAGFVVAALCAIVLILAVR